MHRPGSARTPTAAATAARDHRLERRPDQPDRGAAAEQRVDPAGYTVRPAEARWALTALPEVADARVEFDEDGKLTARITPRPAGAADQAPDAAALTKRLRTLLPGYLRPARLVLDQPDGPSPHH
ncbi:hypothetical protein [Streptomyces sp. CBMA123]|uniref:hypothetical protein n=1 Tax=Streptomyces sp. CBMA123 TaxID=1896313 RepID=UPI001661A14A|nr:hypothetical protein [Streptomyces sp. CBMA123]MBD0695609.1 hypothetical protein [Streptomyces sp. CBMA123]